jgi:tetratricopeptide (TPR) repeat protein
VVEAPVPGVKQVEKETPAPGPVPGLPADLVAQPAPVPEPIDEAVFADEDDAIAAAVAAAVAEFPLKEDVGDDDLPPALAPDLVMERAAEMMELATRYAKEGKLEEADRELERIQTMAPEYVEVYVTRARLYERRDLLNEAKAQWQQVVMWAKDPLLREEAEQAQRRLADESIQRTRAEIRIHEERAEATAARRLSVGDVRQEHLLQSADYDEMRLLRIELQRAPGARPIDVRKVEVVVVFFDRGKTSGTLIRTRAVVPDEPLTLNGVWRNNEKRNVTAAYIVPRDFRRGETRDYGEEFTYYGYVVEVRYEDVVQDRSTNRERLLRSL